MPTRYSGKPSAPAASPIVRDNTGIPKGPRPFGLPEGAAGGTPFSGPSPNNHRPCAKRCYNEGPTTYFYVVAKTEKTMHYKMMHDPNKDKEAA
ncbi:hypothetical protein JCM12178A_02960 [Salidesulfovibrio brasiliensis]